MTAKKHLSRIPDDAWHRLIGALLSGIKKEIRAAVAAAEAVIGWSENTAKKVPRKPKGVKITKRKRRTA